MKRHGIAIVSPSGPLAEEYLTRAVENLERAGQRVEVMPHVRGPRCGVFSASDRDRADDLSWALLGSGCGVVWCARGGYGALRTVALMDPGVFEQTRAQLVGFSDITVLHNAMIRERHFSIHGPMLKHIARFGVDDPAVQATFDLLEHKPFEAEWAPLPGSVNGYARGRLVGGNLSLLVSLRGTKLDIIQQGDILFVEDLNEYNYHIDRMIRTLLYGGVLNKLNGLIIGQMTGMKDGKLQFGRSAQQIISDAAATLGIPVAVGFPAGHQDGVNMPLKLGANIKLSVKDDRVYIDEDLRSYIF